MVIFMNTEQKQYNNEKDIKQINTEEKIDSITTLQQKEINDLTSQIVQNKQKIDDIELRKLAKIENIKKNTKEQIKKRNNIEKEIFLKKIIPAIDALEDILSLSNTLNIKDKPLIKGIELTLNSLFNILLKLGVKMEGTKNDIFNSEIHDIIETKSSEKISDNHIISVHKKGLIFNKILLRKATVTISKK